MQAQKTTADMYEGGYFPAALALFWYAVHYNEGQGCPLYALHYLLTRELNLIASDSTEPGSSAFNAEDNYWTLDTYESLLDGNIDPNDLYSDIVDAVSERHGE
jgi:hypothetical protein